MDFLPAFLFAIVASKPVWIWLTFMAVVAALLGTGGTVAWAVVQRFAGG